MVLNIVVVLAGIGGFWYIGWRLQEIVTRLDRLVELVGVEVTNVVIDNPAVVREKHKHVRIMKDGKLWHVTDAGSKDHMEALNSSDFTVEEG